MVAQTRAQIGFCDDPGSDTVEELAFSVLRVAISSLLLN